jgi:1-deoxy-D-xylulose-5-phosphate reductoisomerase
MRNGPARIVLLGATGSIGESALRVVRALPGRISIAGLSGRNPDLLLQLGREFPEAALCAGDASTAAGLSDVLGRPVLHGEEGLATLATHPGADLVLVAIVGTAGLRPALAALASGKDLAVASKEILVMAGEEVMAAAAKSGRRVLPVDSEHNAIFQCLEGKDLSTVKRLILTCSGGPFRKAAREDLTSVTPEQALRHPTWSMGRKISIDSATLFNKGLEMIEARWLFGIPMDRIDVVIHPQSIVHSMVEFVDGSILAQLGSTDMALPIQYALTYPERVEGPCAPLDLAMLGRLDFEPPRTDLFPALDLARRAGSAGGTLPAVLNAANEAAVEAFLDGRLSFPGIWERVAAAMDAVPFEPHPDLARLVEADAAARRAVRD